MSDEQVSMNWTMLDGLGANIQITLRAAKLADWPEVLKTRKAFLDDAQKTGWTFPGTIKPTVSAPSAAIGLPLSQPMGHGAKAQPMPANGGSTALRANGSAPVGQLDWQGQSASYAATEMSCETKNGKAFWKVKGGQFTKFGIIAWPEVLADAGLAPDVAKAPYNMTGWTAHYINKPDGKPDKIIKLVPPAGDEPF